MLGLTIAKVNKVKEKLNSVEFSKLGLSETKECSHSFAAAIQSELVWILTDYHLCRQYLVVINYPRMFLELCLNSALVRLSFT